MSKALFITANELKKKSIIDGNVDEDKILQYIETAQDVHVQNYLGTRLYDKINDLLVAGTMGDVGNEAYDTLWKSYIKPMHIWFSQETYLPFAMFQVQNGGVYKHSSATGESVNLEEMRMMLQEVRHNAEHYTRRFISYIKENKEDFIEYTHTDDDSDMIPDRDANFSSGWVLGRDDANYDKYPWRKR